jgi:hypothetical protein
MAHEHDVAKAGEVDLIHNALSTLGDGESPEVPRDAAPAWQIDG